jgi:HK97 family phage prohead protease
MDIETRDGGLIDLEYRGLTTPTIRGYAVVFGRRSENLGGFVEEISPAAVDRTLNEKIALRALVDHDTGEIIGRLSAGTLRVAKDERGLRVEIDPPNSPRGQNVVEAIRRRDMTGMSFGFQTLADAWITTLDPPIRTVTDMRIREVSLVSFPAYAQTEAALRSLALARPRQTVTERLAQPRRW